MSHSSRSRRMLLLAVAYLGFISLGLPDTLIGVAWPSVRETFHLQQGAIALIFFGSGLSYFLSSFFTGRLLRSLGIGTLLAGSSALVAISGTGYGVAPIWALFAACSLLHGLGSGAIDAGLNHYVAHRFPARHMNWLHACYSLGATFGPVIMTAAITQRSTWRGGYLLVALLLLALTLLFAATRRQWEGQDSHAAEDSDAGDARAATMGDALRHPLVWLQTAIFFLYTGLEVTAGQWSFTLMTESRGIAGETAGVWVTAYWGSIGLGRVLFGFIVERIGTDRLIRAGLLLALAGAALFAFDLSPAVSGIALALAGLGLAPIYPCLMTQTPFRLGKPLAAHAIGFQVSAAMLGAAALPSLAGFLAQKTSLESVAFAAAAMAVSLYALHEFLLRRAPVR
jgi:fucose permease